MAVRAVHGVEDRRAAGLPPKPRSVATSKKGPPKPDSKPCGRGIVHAASKTAETCHPDLLAFAIFLEEEEAEAAERRAAREPQAESEAALAREEEADRRRRRLRRHPTPRPRRRQR